MARAKLTALSVERAHRSGEPVLLSDGDGLYLRKQTRDGASWTLRYRFAGKEHWLTLGNYPDMSLAQARIEARQARVLLDKQQNPLNVRRAALAEERQKGSFKVLCEDWYRAEVQARGLKHPAVPRRYLDKYLLPKLGRLPASDITPSDIARLLDGIKGRAPTAANDLLRFTRRIFAFGVRRRFVPNNPAADFSPRLDAGGTERPRSRALSFDELAQLFEKIRGTPNFRRGQPARDQAAAGAVRAQGRTTRRPVGGVRPRWRDSRRRGLALAGLHAPRRVRVSISPWRRLWSDGSTPCARSPQAASTSSRSAAAIHGSGYRMWASTP